MGLVKSKLNFLSLINFNWWRGRSSGTSGPEEIRVEDVIDGGVKMYSWDLRPKPPGHRIERQLDQEIILQGGSINGSQVIIENCRNCRIYILDHSAAFNIDDCVDCIIISGPVKGSVFLRDSSNTTLCSVSGQLRLRDCKQIHVFGGAESEPIIEACENISIGPYVLNYDGIGEHFKAALLYPDKLVTNTMYDFTPPISGEGPLNWKEHLAISPASKYLPTPTALVNSSFSTDEAKSYVAQYIQRMTA